MTAPNFDFETTRARELLSTARKAERAKRYDEAAEHAERAAAVFRAVALLEGLRQPGEGR
jgi:HEPN domain-containing protein